MVKKSTFCKILYHRKCKRRGAGGQKKPNIVNVVCLSQFLRYITHDSRAKIYLSMEKMKILLNLLDFGNLMYLFPLEVQP